MRLGHWHYSPEGPGSMSSQREQSRAADREWGKPRSSLGTRPGHGTGRAGMSPAGLGPGTRAGHKQFSNPERETSDRVSCTLISCIQIS